jgi:SAM-dependent methyltransferase
LERIFALIEQSKGDISAFTAIMEERNLPTEVYPPAHYPTAYYLAGLALMLLNKIRHAIRGYKTPRPFSSKHADLTANYSHEIVRHWLSFLLAYTNRTEADILRGKNVVELGPGGDLGAGLSLLARGAGSYKALDANPLAFSAPDEAYHKLFELLRKEGLSFDTEDLIKELRGALFSGGSERMKYICRKDFDLLAALGRDSADLVFSQAAFEHFDEPEKVISQLSETAKSGAVLVTEIDLKTHTRWIRDADPQNIYRYGESLYRGLSFMGSPNRLRPRDYRVMLEKHGWYNVEILPLSKLDASYVQDLRGSLNQRFRDPVNDMEYLSIMLCATKK